MFRKVARLLFVICLFFLAGDALGAPRDKAALKKIDEAIFTHFLNTDFDTAEGLLLGTIRACEDKCSPAVKAKAWMYVGVVRGAGRNDAKGAEEAFKSAVQEDPNIQLDAQVATDEVKQIFAKVSKKGAAPVETGPAPAPAPEGGMKCNLEVTEVESRRPIPIGCESDKDLETAKLFYKGVGRDWASVQMQPVEGVWQATIPCAATQNTGGLQWYVQGLDADNKVVDNFGSKDQPGSLDIVSETSAAPPTFPDKEPPARCSVSEAPPETGGGACGGWGDACGPGDCCDQGLACVDGTCEAASCESDDDCGGGRSCVDGRCRSERGEAGKGAKNWIGVHFAMDLTMLSSDGACTPEGRDTEHFNCFDGDTTYRGTPEPGAGGAITGGFVPSTMRILASYERLFGPVGLEARVGFAFNGGKQPQGGSAFLPIHGEVRAKYWFSGEEGFQKKGFRPYVHLGGGVAQVDATVEVDVREPGGQPMTLEATKVLGLSFVTVGGGFQFGIAPNHGPILNINAMYTIPSTGIVIEPSLGYAFGF